jgi:hypothetical protein
LITTAKSEPGARETVKAALQAQQAAVLFEPMFRFAPERADFLDSRRVIHLTQVHQTTAHYELAWASNF